MAAAELEDAAVYVDASLGSRLGGCLHERFQAAAGVVVDVLAGFLHLEPVEQFYVARQQLFVSGVRPDDCEAVPGQRPCPPC